MLTTPPIIPELDVADLAVSLRFYTEALGFNRRFERPAEQFAYLTRGPVHVMLEQADGPGRRFRTAPLEHPYGRGVNLQIEVSDVDLLHARAMKAGAVIYVSLEERWYLWRDQEVGLRQFVVIDPDGYLLRFVAVWVDGQHARQVGPTIWASPPGGYTYDPMELVAAGCCGGVHYDWRSQYLVSQRRIAHADGLRRHRSLAGHAALEASTLGKVTGHPPRHPHRRRSLSKA